MIRIASATRSERRAFEQESLLGRSLPGVLKTEPVSREIAFENRRGLHAVYNETIARADDDDVLLFVHDDVAIEDFNLVARLRDATQRFDVVGVAGNTRRVPRQPSWAFFDQDGRFVPDDAKNLSGAVGHVTGGSVVISVYGVAPQPVKLLDGLFLCARAGVLKAANVTFDARFDFHFYDLDFCRSCEARGLTMGTWPIAVVHASHGAYDSPAWKSGYRAYLEKWSE